MIIKNKEEEREMAERKIRKERMAWSGSKPISRLCCASMAVQSVYYGVMREIQEAAGEEIGVRLIDDRGNLN